MATDYKVDCFRFRNADYYRRPAHCTLQSRTANRSTAASKADYGKISAFSLEFVSIINRVGV